MIPVYLDIVNKISSIAVKNKKIILLRHETFGPKSPLSLEQDHNANGCYALYVINSLRRVHILAIIAWTTAILAHTLSITEISNMSGIRRAMNIHYDDKIISKYRKTKNPDFQHIVSFLLKKGKKMMIRRVNELLPRGIPANRKITKQMIANINFETINSIGGNTNGSIYTECQHTDDHINVIDYIFSLCPNTELTETHSHPLDPNISQIQA